MEYVVIIYLQTEELLFCLIDHMDLIIKCYLMLLGYFDDSFVNAQFPLYKSRKVHLSIAVSNKTCFTLWKKRKINTIVMQYRVQYTNVFI